MEYIKYQRSFVMLEQESKGFAMKQSDAAKGHLKIETGGNKGALRIGVENIKPFEKQEYIYKLIFFGKDDEKTIYSIIGTVKVGSVGNGESYFRFNPQDMDGKGHNVSQFTHAIVAAVSTKEDDEPLHPILKGYISIQGEESAVQQVDAAEQGTAAEQVTQTGAVESIQPYSGNVQVEVATFNSFYNGYLLERCREIEHETNAYDRILPFREDVTEALWNKVNVVDAFPLVSPGGIKLAQKYKHYIFGISDDCYYIGIPGRFLKEEQPERGSSGFRLWQPILGAEKFNAMDPDCPDKNRFAAYGYWIVGITKDKGDIIEA